MYFYRAFSFFWAFFSSSKRFLFLFAVYVSLFSNRWCRDTNMAFCKFFQVDFTHMSNANTFTLCLTTLHSRLFIRLHFDAKKRYMQTSCTLKITQSLNTTIPTYKVCLHAIQYRLCIAEIITIERIAVSFFAAFAHTLPNHQIERSFVSVFVKFQPTADNFCRNSYENEYDLFLFTLNWKHILILRSSSVKFCHVEQFLYRYLASSLVHANLRI